MYHVLNLLSTQNMFKCTHFKRIKLHRPRCFGRLTPVYLNVTVRDKQFCSSPWWWHVALSGSICDKYKQRCLESMETSVVGKYTVFCPVEIHENML